MRATGLPALLVFALTACSAPSGAPTGTSAAPVSAEAAFSHVVSTDTAYYLTGPQQARPPDGTLESGSKVRLIEDAGSYSLVESEGGVRAFVSSRALRPIGATR